MNLAQLKAAAVQQRRDYIVW